MKQQPIDGKEPSDIYEYPKVLIAPGKFNPPTVGHKGIFEELRYKAQQLLCVPMVLIIDVGRIEENKPLSGPVRRSYIKTMTGNEEFVQFKLGKNPYEAFQHIVWEEKLFPIGCIVGSDRDLNYEGLVNRAFGMGTISKAFKTYTIPRTEETKEGEINSSNVSSTIIRTIVKEDKFDEFVKAYRFTGLSYRDVMNLYHDIRTGMNISNGVNTYKENNTGSSK